MESVKRLFALLSLGFVVTPAFGEGKTAPSKPIVLMLIVESEDLAALQEEVKNELEMEIITHTLLVKFTHRFSSDSLSERIEEIRRLAVVSRAEAVIWLEKVRENNVSLHLFAAGFGRSIVRSVEATASVDTGGELAIAARDLLREIHIELNANPPSPQREAPSTASPDERDTRSTSPAPPEIALSGGRRLDLFVGLVTTGGFNGTSQSPVLLGGVVSIGLYWKSGLYADLSLDAFANLASTLQNGTVRTVGARPGIGVGFFWDRGLVAFGPYLGLQAPWQTARTAIGANRESKDSWWNFRAVPSFDLRISLHRNILLSMTPGLGILVHQEVFERVTDGVDIYKSPYLEWHIRCGVVFAFD